jgi:hypothetical protein
MLAVDRHFVVDGAVQSEDRPSMICDCMLRQAHVLLSVLTNTNFHASKPIIAMHNRRCVSHPRGGSAAETGDALDRCTDGVEQPSELLGLGHGRRCTHCQELALCRRRASVRLSPTLGFRGDGA